MVLIPCRACDMRYAHFLALDLSSISYTDRDERILLSIYCPCAAPLTRPEMVWARRASASPPSAIYRLLLACTRWFSFWLAVMYKSAAQAKKKVAMANAKAVRSLYRLVKKPLILPSTRRTFQATRTRDANGTSWSRSVANKVFIADGSPSGAARAHGAVLLDDRVSCAETAPAGR